MRIIITGASRGIGFDTALSFSQDHQVLALSRNEAALRQLEQTAIERFGKAQLHYLPFDLTAPNWSALDEKVKQLGGVDILINNAGLLVNKPFSQLDHADWQQLFAVNFFGPADLIRHLQGALEKSSQAHVVNISSMGGFQGSSKFPGLSGYSASKAAIANLTECLAEEWKEKGIAVNCLALGAVQTEMLAHAFPGLQAPLRSEEMAEFLSWFALQGHRFFNGKILPVSVSTP